MQLTFNGAPKDRFVIDGVTLTCGESTTVADERGEALLREYPDVLKGVKTPDTSASKDSQEPSTKAAKSAKGIAPTDPKGE